MARFKVVTLSEISRHGGILAADHYVPNPEPIRERIALLERRREAIDAELKLERERLARREAGVACDDPRHRA